jgi:hypothetical protein
VLGSAEVLGKPQEEESSEVYSLAARNCLGVYLV